MHLAVVNLHENITVLHRNGTIECYKLETVMNCLTRLTRIHEFQTQVRQNEIWTYIEA